MDNGSGIVSGGIGRAYNTGKSLAGGPSEAAGAAPAQSFADMVRGAASNAVQTVREADAAGQAGLTGQLGTQQVIEATMALESTVKVTVAMRDKFVEAYQEIMRMPI
ncbi:flagellar biosynthesis protein [Tabrizicola sp. WMC-M-20]|nr:flagellar biosynthesis protein [Tabrizicola sp. WMC-M-20]